MTLPFFVTARTERFTGSIIPLASVKFTLQGILRPQRANFAQIGRATRGPYR